MFLLDTNVVSETRRIASGRASQAVVSWLASVDPATSFVSAMTIYELELGIRQMERRDSQQGASLREWFDETVLPGFSGRVLAMTEEIGIQCAQLHVPDPAAERDSWIAATALVHGLTVVTRNIGDFQRGNLTVLNPWDIIV